MNLGFREGGCGWKGGEKFLTPDWVTVSDCGLCTLDGAIIIDIHLSRLNISQSYFAPLNLVA
jgi:hypothetical protein